MTYFKSKPCAEYGCSKPVFSKGLCKYHAAIKALKTPNKKVVSEKKKERLAKYYELRDAYLKEHPVCEVEGCEHQATQIHHKMGRGDNLHKHFLAVCFDCHRRIEDNPSFAYENEYSLKRNYKYEE